jgi:hypothetical protein
MRLLGDIIGAIAVFAAPFGLLLIAHGFGL